MKKTIMVIDGSSLLHRAFYAIPLLSNKKGVYTNAVYGFLNMLIKLLQDYKPYSLAVAFDKKAPTFRHLAYEAYKGTRQKAPEELVPQFDLIREVLLHMGIPIFELDGYEADDILGTVSQFCGSQEQHILLVTGDKDALQLISDNVEVLLTQKGISVIHRYDTAELAEEYGLTPEQFIDMKGLMGDSSDNIPGVPGIGPKTAVKLLKEYGTLENVLDNTENIKERKVRENLTIYRQHALLSKDLATIRRDAPIDCSILSQPVEITKTPELKQLLVDLELKSVIEKLDMADIEVVETEKAAERSKTVVEIRKAEDLQSLAEQLLSQEEIALLAGHNISIAWQDDKAYRICLKEDLLSEGLMDDEVWKILQPVIENKKVRKVANNSKSTILFLNKMGISLEGLDFDTQIGAYLLEPTRNKYDVEQLLYDYNNINVAQADASDLMLLSRTMKKRLKEANLEDLYRQIEHPLIHVLVDMELAGFKVDKEMLQQLDEEFSAEVKRLTQEIIELAGEEFNLNSPKQLGEILFEKLGLPVQKKTKTGYSTDIEVLEKLEGMHPIIEKLIDYRQVMKLKSTYIDGLLHVINPCDGKIHSNFNQTVTATGRISSTEPNLQNIPVRVEMGRKIRKVFTASDNKHILVDADYSQIELRVLAHISGDPNLIEAFNKKEDIHRRTAADIFNVPIEQVTSEQRNSAKAVNFGIVYGISDYGLARNLGIPRVRAKRYIESYLQRYPKVKEYMDRIIAEGKKNGYVTTLMNRRRDIPELSSRNFNIRSFGERIALNTPIQGTAADIIKLAMIRVHGELKRRNLKSRLILQVHDELIVDACIDELEEVKKLLKEQMENAMELSVPLVVDIGTGWNWYDAK
ncbi:MAG TPA: DNA polymerase I [Clostridiales bacterium]|nr:DNA polymerase I [Clostridiales bacterium]